MVESGEKKHSATSQAPPEPASLTEQCLLCCILVCSCFPAGTCRGGDRGQPVRGARHASGCRKGRGSQAASPWKIGNTEPEDSIHNNKTQQKTPSSPSKHRHTGLAQPKGQLIASPLTSSGSRRQPVSGIHPKFPNSRICVVTTNLPSRDFLQTKSPSHVFTPPRKDK